MVSATLGSRAAPSKFRSLAIAILFFAAGYLTGVEHRLPPAAACVQPAQSAASGSRAPEDAARAAGGARLASVSPLLRHMGCSMASAEDSFLVMFKSGVTGKVVVDVGVYKGVDFTIPAAAAGHTVYAFEPTADKQGAIAGGVLAAGRTIEHVNLTACARAGACVALQPSANVMLVRAAAAAKTEITSIVVAAHPMTKERDASGYFGALNSLVNDETAKNSPFREEVPAVRLDEVIPPTVHVYILKVDAQGFDGVVLAGAEGLLLSGRVSIVIFEWWPTELDSTTVSARDTLALLGKHGFFCFDFTTDEASGKPLNTLPLEPLTGDAWIKEFPRLAHQLWGSGPWSDLFCVHRRMLDDAQDA
jgi:FkbM family methyltransferase